MKKQEIIVRNKEKTVELQCNIHPQIYNKECWAIFPQMNRKFKQENDRE